MGAVTCAGALDSSPVVSTVTNSASGDFGKSCLFVSIFAIYASQDASYRVFKVRSLCSASGADRKKRRVGRDCGRVGYNCAACLNVSGGTHRSGCVRLTPLSERSWGRGQAVKLRRQISVGFSGAGCSLGHNIILYSTQNHHEIANSASFFIS